MSETLHRQKASACGTDTNSSNIKREDLLDREKVKKIYKHYGIYDYKEKIKSGEIEHVDFLIGREEDIKELTANMAGFGTEQSQRVIIEYDKGYGYFFIKRIPMKYGASEDAPKD